MAQGENQVAEVKTYRDSRGERRDGCAKSRPECSEGNRDERERDGRLKGLLTQRAFSGQKGGKKKTGDCTDRSSAEEPGVLGNSTQLRSKLT